MPTPGARRALQAMVMLALWGLITHGTHAGTGDEPHYLAITHSIAFDGDLDLANNYGAASRSSAAACSRPALTCGRASAGHSAGARRRHAARVRACRARGSCR